LGGSATSVDVEEQLYRLASDMGITFITSSQVSGALIIGGNYLLHN
jgi:hypothetical protein